MKITSLLLIAFVALPASTAVLNACTSCAAGAVVAIDETPQRHPLKGVIIDVVADKSALLVKHEEIPGVMKAMTMLLKVDADTLKSSAATKGTAITGFLVRKTDGWWLEEVAAVPVK